MASESGTGERPTLERHWKSRVCRSNAQPPHPAGLPVTCEVNAHHLTWAEEDVPVGGTLYKCMPPLRDRANLEALWDGLKVPLAARVCPFRSIVWSRDGGHADVILRMLHLVNRLGTG